MIFIKGGVTAPNGFHANGVKAGLKRSGKKDLALLYSEVPSIAAASFTKNRFQASPVKISKMHLKNKIHQAIIVNSGNANCANGNKGDKDALFMTDLIAAALGLDKKEVLVASTGIIGKYLPVKKIEDNIPPLVRGLSKGGGAAFAESIMTTDTKKKEMAVKVRLGRSTVTIGGACKGVGMIYPDMKLDRHATMLSFITTDCAISRSMLNDVLGEAIEDSFNMVSVDGDMSTNDSCFLLANGLAGNKRIVGKGKDYYLFLGALKYLTKTLAKMLAEDGEGATKFVEIIVSGAGSTAEAKEIARKISTSSLLKCAIFGGDPNWGRVAAAAGASGVEFNPDKIDIYLGDVLVLSSGASVKGLNTKKTARHFRQKAVKITLDLKAGRAKATAWTCDFSKEYVQINSEYST